MKNLPSIILLAALLGWTTRAATWYQQVQPTPVSAYMDFEAGNDGDTLTTGILDSGTHNSIGAWSLVPSSTNLSVRAAAQFLAPTNPFSISSTTYNDSGTRGLSFSDNAVSHYAQYTLTSSVNSLSLFCYIKFGPVGDSFNTYDHIAVQLQNGEFAIVNENDDINNLIVRMHTSTGTGGAITVKTNTWYALTMKATYNVGGTMSLYDATTWKLIGTSTLAYTMAASPIVNIQFGRADAHGGTQSATQTLIDNLVIDTNSAAFPLTPELGARVGDLTLTNAQAVCNAAASGTWVFLPGLSNLWSTNLVITNNIVLSGLGSSSTFITNNASTTNGDNTECTILLNGGAGTGTRVTGISFEAGTPGIGLGVQMTVNNTRVDHCNFHTLYWGTHSKGSFSVCDHSTFVNCTRMGRIYGIGDGTANWATYYPIPYNSTNYMFYEDNTITSDGTAPAGPTDLIVCSSGDGSSYIVRNCTFTSSVKNFAPLFDAHGDNIDTTRGNLSLQIYSNKFTFSGSGTVSKCIDWRGGQGLAYSNVVTGATSTGIYLREEDPGWSLPVIDVVTNAYIWANLENGGGTMSVTVPNDGSQTYIGLNTNYFLSAISPFQSPVYPHPLIGPAQYGGGGAGGGGILASTGTRGRPGRR